MSKFLVSTLLFVITIPLAFAQSDSKPKTPKHDMFMARQQEYITKVAKLTKDEAKAFFPIYFELQEKKRAINDEAWENFWRGDKEGTTEESYSEILDAFTESSLAADRLEKTYLAKFKKVLSSKKIYLVKKAEMGYRRELVKSMRPTKEPARRH